MKNYRGWFQAFLLLTVVWFSSFGCVTKQVWSDKREVKPYIDTIISFYSNVEQQEILFLGEKYHYIFSENTVAFMELLKAKSFLKLSDENIKVYATINRGDNRKVEANIMLYFKESGRTSAQMSWLTKHGFNARNVDRYFGKEHRYLANEKVEMMTVYTRDYSIRGRRYIAEEKVNAEVVRLKKPMQIEIVEFYRSDKKSRLYKVAMTPLSVTADAGLIIVGVGAAIIYAPFALTYAAYEEIKGE